MRRNVYLAVLSGLMLGLAAMLSGGSTRNTALAEGGCSNHSLLGPYGFAVEGQAFNPPGPGYHEFAEFADAGRIIFDGRGHLSGTDTESLNGAIAQGLTFAGTYNVESDCTGTAAISGGITAHLKFMLVERGQEVNVFDTDPGLVAAGQVTRQDIGQCSDATFHGVYGAAVTGNQFGATGETADVAELARLVSDGRGHLTGSENFSFNGAQFAATDAGTYHVNSDCTGSATSAFLTGPFAGHTETVDFVMVEGGKEGKFIVTTPGVVLSGAADKQPMDAD